MGETSLTLILPDDLDVNDAQILQRVAAPRRATFGREYGNVTVNIVNSFHSFSPLDVQSHQMDHGFLGNLYNYERELTTGRRAPNNGHLEGSCALGTNPARSGIQRRLLQVRLELY